MEEYITVSGQSTGEYSEKHSRFLAALFPCETEEQAAEILSQIRSERWDARHHCYAYCVNGGAVKRFSDDGEPHGTAGKPILEVVEAGGFTNVLLVVTRYFGGVLLGTGGLVRAYTAAAKEAVAAAKPVKMTLCRVYNTVCSYADHEKLAKL
ncbi:MAG: YigZ family protein, partial [Clostridia bacterium]|nr:YigZ family protein [Clostridia bacterium]